MKKIVSFDYDDTLTKDDVAAYARELIDKGVEVWVTTYRYSPEYYFARGEVNSENNGLFDDTEELGIPSNRIIFTDRRSKSLHLPNNCIWHLDDFEDAIKCIDTDDTNNSVGVWLTEDNDWKQKCEELLWMKEK